MSSKTFEPLDVMRYALPNLSNIDTRLTASNPELITYLGGRGWGAYSPMWKRMPRIWKGALPDAEISKWWKTPWLVDGMKALRDHYQGHGRWYPLGQEVRVIGGIKFRSSARGVLFTKEQGAELHVINPRKSQTVELDTLGFLARVAYEEYAINDPNHPAIAVLDMGTKGRSKTRHMKMLRGPSIEMMGVEHFEFVMNSFLEALKIADVASYGSIKSVNAADFRVPK